MDKELEQKISDEASFWIGKRKDELQGSDLLYWRLIIADFAIKILEKYGVKKT